jgi:hypothetical protein
MEHVNEHDNVKATVAEWKGFAVKFTHGNTSAGTHERIYALN